jgi:NAD/NADP transhydrogenase alpha subunit
MNFIKTLSAATLLVAAGSAFAQSGFQSADFGRDGVARVVPSQRAESDAKHAQAFGRDVPATRAAINGKVAPESARSSVALERVGRS